MKIPPPILSRVYQTISRGFVNLLNTRLGPSSRKVCLAIVYATGLPEPHFPVLIRTFSMAIRLKACLTACSAAYADPQPRKKITDTKFPFPFAQIIACFLLVHIILTPALISASVPSKVLAPFFTFLAVFGMFSLRLGLK